MNLFEKYQAVARTLADGKNRNLIIKAMDAIWDDLAMPLYRIGFRISPDIVQAEDLVVQLQSDVQEGRATLRDYQLAVENLVLVILPAMSGRH